MLRFKEFLIECDEIRDVFGSEFRFIKEILK